MAKLETKDYRDAKKTAQKAIKALEELSREIVIKFDKGLTEITESCESKIRSVVDELEKEL